MNTRISWISCLSLETIFCNLVPRASCLFYIKALGTRLYIFLYESSVYFISIFLVPSLPPASVQIQAVNSQTILVSWKTVPSNSINGILKGYKILYFEVKKPQHIYTKLVLSAQQSQLTGLNKFTIYEIAVLAYTEAGDGKKSIPMYKRTLEDSKHIFFGYFLF